MSVIFDDLGIDYSTVMSDPEHFWGQVLEAAETLKTVLKADNSVDSYLKKIAAEEFDFKTLDNKMMEIYNWAEDSVPVGALHEMANKLRKLAKDIEYLARDKAIVEIADDQTMDKTVAFEMYKDLREQSSKIVDGWKVFNMYEVDKLPSMPGNYGGITSLTHYVFIFKDDEDEDKIPYRSVYGVVRRLEREGNSLPEIKNLMDLVDFLNAHPELNVQVAQVSK